ncbi:protein GVQW3 [Trichonephila clavipes]|nr:protein GVQW3 [Trichonephila clavipes]
MKKQKINLKFCLKLGKTSKETYVMLVCVHEDQTLSMKCAYEWFARFQEAWESVSDKTRSRRLGTFVSDKNVEKVKKLIMKDLRLTVHMTADEQQIIRESVRLIVKPVFMTEKNVGDMVHGFLFTALLTFLQPLSPNSS